MHFITDFCRTPLFTEHFSISAFCCKCIFISPTYVHLFKVICSHWHSFLFSLPCWQYSFTFFNLPVNISQLCQHKLHLTWKYVVFIVKVISSSHQNIANPKDKCWKYHFCCIRLTNWCLISIPWNITHLVILPETYCVFQLQSYPYSIVLAQSKKMLFVKSQKHLQLWKHIV